MLRTLRQSRSFAVGATVYAALALVTLVQRWRELELLGFDALTRIAPPACGDVPLVLVGIDDDSFAELAMRWPWPRDLHARLVETLARAGARVIAFDVIFSEPSTPAADARLASAIRDTRGVVLAADESRVERPHVAGRMRVDPIPELLEAGAESGITTVSLDRDAILRRMPTGPDRFWEVVLRRFGEHGGLAPPRAPAPGERIRFHDPTCPFRYASYYQALEPARFLPEGFFSDRIALVGLRVKAVPTTGSPEADRLATPLLAATRELTPGVEAQAHVLATALTGRSVREAPRWAALALLAGALGLGTAGMRRWRPLAGLGVALLCASGSMLLALGLFAAFDLWLPFLVFPLGLGLLYLAHGALAFLDERRQRERIRSAFSHYVSPQIVDEMTEHPERLVLGGERREITVLFSDLAGFTAMAEKMAPEEVHRILNRHLTRMTEVVFAHGGTLDKFIGDALMAFWGAPLPDPEDALHACESALAMQLASRELREEFAREGLPPVHARIGIHSGVAVVGNMGSARRFDYTAVGDAVNLASRLEGANRECGTEILISEATARRVEGRIALRRVDVIRVKGRSEAVEVYTIAEAAAEAR